MTSFDNAHQLVCELVERFQNGIHHYTSPAYHESEVRQDFIDDFFTALGWDVRHRTQQNPYEQEVKIEKGQRQHQARAQKRADYAFSIAPRYNEVKFFVEAKKPSTLLRNEDHYFQTIRYGWNANTPVAILTDFKEFHLLDCRIRPEVRFIFNGTHKVFHFTDYLDKEKFAEIYWLFSREAVAGNSIEKYALNMPKAKAKVIQRALFKGGYQAIDESFLGYIDTLREDLAKAFKNNDENLNGEELTEAVQRTIDRLVFIRFLEDKLIEPVNHVSEWRGWKDFIADCRKLDVKYNGIVFKKHFIDDHDFSGAEERLFESICSEISSLNSPYDFNYIPIHILGSIYERFLGKIVVATDKKVHIEEKPEVRKAGGVYYTPKPIVDYIVGNTIGSLIEGKTPKQIQELYFGDIACGSGSFLIGVYELLLEYHKKYYNEKLANRTEIDGRSEDFGNTVYKDGQWTLTLKLKQNILLNNIYGVDIDTQAVEVTQLSLFLKMLEDESLSTTQLQQGAIFSKVLPDLSKNIVCGNSLIGTDFSDGQLFALDEEKKVNPMDYESSFPEIFRKGGFHAIVGNPPYVMLQNLESRNSFEYALQNSVSAKYKIDAYQLFIEKGIKLLNASAYLSFIVPNTFLKNIHAEPLRKFILDKTSIIELLIFDYNVFKGASVDTLVFIFRNEAPKGKLIVRHAKDSSTFIETNQVDQNDFTRNEKSNFNIDVQGEDKSLLKKIEKNSITLGSYCNAYFGIQTFNRSRYVSSEKVSHDHQPVIDGGNIDPYYLWPSSEFVCFKPDAIKSGGNPVVYQQERICIRQIGETPIATLVPGEIYTLNTIYNVYKKDSVEIDLHFILAIINSKLNKYHWRKSNFDHKGTFPKIKKGAILNIPIPKFHDKEKKLLSQDISTRVVQLLEVKNNLFSAKTDKDKNFLENKILNLTNQIDRSVYELFDLSSPEINIIEKDFLR